MHVSLFSQNLILLLCGLDVGLLVYLCLRIDNKDKKVQYISLGLLFASSLILSFIFQILTSWITQAGGDLPSKFWLMILPLTFSLCLLASLPISRWYLKRHRKKAKKARKQPSLVDRIRAIKRETLYLYLFAGCSVLVSLIFSLVIINSYYHYYPTLATVFDEGMSRTSVLAERNQVIVQYNKEAAHNDNIEASIYNTKQSTINGKLYSLYIPGKVSKFKPRVGWIYLPSIAFNKSSLVKLPVLIMLPGVPGETTDLLYGGGLVSTLSTFAKEHHGITPIVYVADDDGSQFNDTECVNSPAGNVETYLSVDVPNYIKSHFNVSDNPSNWAIGGISMGGMCGVMLTLTHPNVYHYFVDIGGEAGPEVGTIGKTVSTLFGGSTNEWNLHQPQYLLATRKYTGVGGFFGDGNSDPPSVIIGTNADYAAAKNDGLDVVHETVQGGHTFDVFSKLINNSLPWISNRIGATECTGSLLCQ